MKWRSSIIYLVVLALLGSYYYYFEVVKKEQKAAENREAKRIFHFKVKDVESLVIESMDKEPVRLVRNGSWHITEPIRCQADQATMVGFLDTVATLEAERDVTDSPGDLKIFGLNKPALTLKIHEKNQSMQLMLGNKNPTGDGYYSKIASKNDVFLLPQGVWGILHKGADELRRRELFAFDPEKVVDLGVVWGNGEKVSVERSQTGDTWRATNHADIKIKTSKVENAIDQLRWLRAQKFLENDVKQLETNGLAPPKAAVKLRLADGKALELKLGNKSKDGKELTAVSSELPAVVTIDADILNDLPKNVASLEDRSLIGIKANDIGEVRWHLGDKGGRFVKMGEDTWGIAAKEGQPKELNDSWQVSSLIYDLAQAEYLKQLNPTPAIPTEVYGRLEFYENNKKLASLMWSQKLEPSSKSKVIWIAQGKVTPQAVEVEQELIRRMEEDLNKFAQNEPQKP